MNDTTVIVDADELHSLIKRTDALADFVQHVQAKNGELRAAPQWFNGMAAFSGVVASIILGLAFIINTENKARLAASEVAQNRSDFRAEISALETRFNARMDRERDQFTASLDKNAAQLHRIEARLNELLLDLRSDGIQKRSGAIEGRAHEESFGATTTHEQFGIDRDYRRGVSQFLAHTAPARSGSAFAGLGPARGPGDQARDVSGPSRDKA